MAFWTIASKDVRLLIQDRRALAVLLAFPMIFITIIGLTTGKLLGWKNSNETIQIVYFDGLDYDAIQTPYDDRALDLRERKRAANIVSKTVNALQEGQGVQVYSADDQTTAVRMAHGGTNAQGQSADVAVLFEPDFYRKLMATSLSDAAGVNPAPVSEQLAKRGVRVVSDNPDSSTHTLMEELVWANLAQQSAPYVICQGGVTRTNFTFRARCEELEVELDRPAIERLPPTEEPERSATGGGVYDEIVPSYTVMFVFFLVTVMARQFLHERDLGTLRRLRLAPVRPVGLLVGKTLPFFLLSVAQTALLFLFGRVLFGMPWGPEPWLIVPVLLATSLAATALGLLVSTVVRSEQQVSSYANLIVITAAGISGCFLPREWLSDQMRTLSLATPHAWSLIAYNSILSTPEPDAALVARCCGMLLLFAAGFFTLGVWKFRKFAA
jgi:ABC-2 type transport system permease protein